MCGAAILAMNVISASLSVHGKSLQSHPYSEELVAEEAQSVVEA